MNSIDALQSNEMLHQWELEQEAGGSSGAVAPEHALRALAEVFRQSGSDLISMIGLLRLKGKPYSLNRHFTMEPMFRLDLPNRILWKAGRQVSKSTSLAAQGIIMTACLPNFSTMFVTPLFEQTRRFSSNYIRPFLRSGVVGNAMMSASLDDTVLQKTFTNGSQMHFTFAGAESERVRGVAADKAVIDEVQNIDTDHLPIITATLDASEDWGIEQYSGTPKTLDNLLQIMWEDSSQAEWVMKCPHCGHWNEPNLAGRVLRMIQPDGLSCARCEKVGLSPGEGEWQHMNMDRYPKFAAYHIPQIIMPMHYAIPERWERLHEKKVALPPSIFMNEVLGESCDVGAKLITLKELKEACRLPHANIFDEGVKYAQDGTYVDTVLGVDWGGGGLNEISLTAAAAIGLKPNGKVDVFQLLHIKPGFRQDEEAQMLLRMYWQYRCSTFGHDFGGAGHARETIMITAGLQPHHVMGFLYLRVKSGDMVEHRKPARSTRSWYATDKARTLTFMCSLIQAGEISFPRYETCQKELKDILALTPDKMPTRSGSDLYFVTSNARVTDDVAHALNFALLALYHRNQKWPNLAKAFEVNANEEVLSAVDPRLSMGDDFDMFNDLERAEREGL